MQARVIDIHNHGYSKKFFDAVQSGEGERYGLRIGDTPKGRALLKPDGGMHPLQPKRADYAGNLTQLATAGIDAYVLSMPPYVNFVGCDEPTNVWACRQINDGLADIEQEYDGRIYAMGMVPLPFGCAAADELERGARELKIRAVQIITNYGGRDLDDAEFLPFFERAEKFQTMILIHPDLRAGFNGSFKSYYLQNLIGLPVETTTAAASLIFGGVMERFPGLKIVLAHGGGVSPYLVGRWRHGHGHRPEPKIKFTGSPEEMLRRFYFDTMIYEPQVLRFLTDLVGADHIVMGTDYSGDMSAWREVSEISRLEFLAESQKQQILGGNARRLLGLDAA
jgi:aminocarboxymuconate-semialdehyde decarboxylase